MGWLLDVRYVSDFSLHRHLEILLLEHVNDFPTMATHSSHGEPEIFAEPVSTRPQRPLTAEEKLEQTKYDIESSTLR